MKKHSSIKIIALLIVFVINNISLVLAENETDYAKAVFGSEREYINMSCNESLEAVERDGRGGIKTNISKKALFILCDVADSFLYDLPEYTPIDITVEYFDEGKGCFSLNYDSHNTAPYFENDPIWNRSEDTVYLNDTREWKSYTFHVEDMRFTNRCSYGTDFRIGVWDPVTKYSSDNVIFGAITVKKSDYKILIDSDTEFTNKPGHIFSGTEDIVLTDVSVNKTDREVHYKRSFKIIDEQNREIFTCSEEEDFAANERMERKIVIDNPGKYGYYTLQTESVSVYKDDETKIYTDTEAMEFSVCIIHEKGEGNPNYGVCQQITEFGWGDPVTTTELMRMNGMSYIREQYQWRNIEREKGILKMPEDALEKLRKISKSGMEVVYICSFTNPLYDEGRNPSSDEAIAAFARYCAYMAKTLKGISSHFEVWNEWNLKGSQFNQSGEPPETYAKLLKASYKAIKEADPNITVLGVATSEIDIEWTKSVFDEGGYDYLDAVSIHPYDWSGSFREYQLVEDVNELKSLMQQYGEEKPIWMTEIGFTTAVGNYSQEEQAAKTVLMFAMIRAYDLCEVVTQYQFTDLADPERVNSCWGFVNRWDDARLLPYGPKKIYLATAAMNEIFGKNTVFKNILTDKRFYGVHFYNDNFKKDVLLLISGDGEKNKSYKLGCTTVELRDMYGNVISQICSDNGIYTFPVGETPLYVIGNFNSFEESEIKGAVECDTAEKNASVNDEVQFDFIKNSSRELTIDFEGTYGIEVKENNGFTDNKARLVLSIPNIKQEKAEVIISVKDNAGNIYYKQPHVITIEKPAAVSIASEQAVEGSKTHWRMRVTVKNMKNSAPISGTLKITDPEEVAAMSYDRQFTGIAPGEEIAFLFNLPERVVKKTINVSMKANLDDGNEIEVKQILQFCSAVYTDKPPEIDGVMSVGEWTGSWIGAENKSDVKLIENWAGKEDLSVSSCMMWDEENFYFLGIVTDDIFSVNYSPQEPSQMWKGDGMQFGIDDREFVNVEVAGKFTEIGIASVPGFGDTVYRSLSLYDLPAGTVAEKAKASVKRYGAYTIYECAIPWSEIFYEGYIPDRTKKYRFSMLVNDNDGNSRRGWIEYCSGIGVSKNVFEFGEMKLDK